MNGYLVHPGFRYVCVGCRTAFASASRAWVHWVATHSGRISTDCENCYGAGCDWCASGTDWDL